MVQPADESTLADRHYITLILRLTLDQDGQVIQGQLVDTTNALPEPFIGASGLNQAVAAWLRQQEQAKADEQRR